MLSAMVLSGTLCPLNESPSEKEGKSRAIGTRTLVLLPSMKVPPKRKGNDEWRASGEVRASPQ